MKPVLAIVVPCYNEEEVLPSTAETLGKLLEDMIAAAEVAEGSYICFVNDGSRDRTWSIICELHERSPRFCGVNLSRNFGHQSALLAGLFHRRGRCLRGIIPMLGFPCECVYYKRMAHELGESKYPLMKMLRLAWNGVVNFSDFPLLFMVWAGVVGFLLSLALIAWSIIEWSLGNTLPGWTSTVSIVSAFSSLQFLFIGVIGLYIGKIFRETKRRPIYVIQDDSTPKSSK